MKVTVSLVSATEATLPLVTDITIETRDLDGQDPRAPGDVTVTGATQAGAVDLLRLAARLVEGAA